MQKFYCDNLERERTALKLRLKELKGEDLTKFSDEEFDNLIGNEIENFNVYDVRGIKNEFSYNLVHVDEFKNYAISDYKL